MLRSIPVAAALLVSLSFGASAQADVATGVTLDGVAMDGVFALSNGWSGRIWGIEPGEGYARWLWESHQGVELACEHVGTIDVRIFGTIISDPIFVCATPTDYIHDTAIAAGVAVEACAATGGALGGTESGTCARH